MYVLIVLVITTTSINSSTSSMITHVFQNKAACEAAGKESYQDFSDHTTVKGTTRGRMEVKYSCLSQK